jgi:cell division septum initiation protein DivIVA
MGSAGLSQVTTAQAQDDTSGDADLLPGAAAEERFEVARRGYDRGQVEEFVARSRREAVGMRNRLVKALREAEQLRVDLAAARQAAWEAGAQKDRVARELAALRTQAEMALARNLWWPSPRQDGG